MNLQELIWKRLCQSKEVTNGLSRFASLPAIFVPEAPSDKANGWEGKTHYPRICFTVDLAANEERNCQGSLVVSIFNENDGSFDSLSCAEAVKLSLCNLFLTPDKENPYAFAWNRSDGFFIEGSSICGMELQFDILEYPSQQTTDPDPVEACNYYLKQLYPEALVLWNDRTEQMEEIDEKRPAFYCRLEQDKEDESRATFAVAWMECQLAIHVFCPTSSMRNQYARSIEKQLTVNGEFSMLDRSPFFVLSSAFDTAADYFRKGQIMMTGRYGILRQTERKKKIALISTDYQ